ncbi:MAG: dipicolinate synthase subunit B [Eubacteriales bacterium]|nr:dipicolinate synthase subunit B [Eubacteriales bacterium]
MDLAGKRIGFALTGSFCTYRAIMPVIQELVDMGAEVTPILSYAASNHDTRFIKAAELKHFLTVTTGKEIIDSIVAAEPIGPQKLLDLLIVAPCTGNTLAKLASGVTDTPVLLAAKAHLRNARPVLIAVSTNDALAANAKNLGALLNTKNIYFVPYRQDNALKKCTSIVADMGLIVDAAKQALEGKQIQPVMLAPQSG